MTKFYNIDIDYNIEVKPWWLRLINNGTYLVWFGTLYVKNIDNKKWLKASNDLSTTTIKINRGYHLKRQKELGYYRWHWKYFWSKKFRYIEELEACVYELQYKMDNGIIVNVRKYTSLLLKAIHYSIDEQKVYKDIVNKLKEHGIKTL